MSGPLSRFLTRVALVFVARRINVYLRFGRPLRQTRVDAQRRVAEFAPGSVFCRLRWQANDYGTTTWQLMVLQAMPRSEVVQRVFGIVPGAALLLHADGARDVQVMLRLIDTIEAHGIDPADVAVRYWRAMKNRLAAHADVSPYTLDRHAAYLACRTLA